MNRKVLVFDDDESYGKILMRQGKKMNLDVTYCVKMDEFCIKVLENNFDVAFIDYNLLENFKGDVVAGVVEDRPTYIMSSDERVVSKQSRWPNTVKGFIGKSETPEAILRRVLDHFPTVEE